MNTEGRWGIEYQIKRRRNKELQQLEEKDTNQDLVSVSIDGSHE